MRSAAFAALAIAALSLVSVRAVADTTPVISTNFQLFAATPGPIVHLTGGQGYCQVTLNYPFAYAFLSPQESNDTYTWVANTTIGGGSMTQPGVYYGAVSKPYFRFILTQVNFPGVTGHIDCGNSLPLQLYANADAQLNSLVLLTQVGNPGCAQFDSAGALTSRGTTCNVGPTPYPTPTVSATATACGAPVSATLRTVSVPVCPSPYPTPATPTPAPTPSPVASTCIGISGAYPYTISATCGQPAFQSDVTCVSTAGCSTGPTCANLTICAEVGVDGTTDHTRCVVTNYDNGATADVQAWIQRHNLSPVHPIVVWFNESGSGISSVTYTAHAVCYGS